MNKSKIIRNPFSRKGNPKGAEDEEDSGERTDGKSQEEESDVEANFVRIIKPHSLEEALASP